MFKLDNKIKKGSTRIVYLIGNYAIKMPRFKTYEFKGYVASILEGWLCNRNERNWYKSKMFDFLCPIKLSLFFSFIIIMERAKPISYKEFSSMKRINFDGHEHKIDSYGIINNKVVVVDYG